MNYMHGLLVLRGLAPLTCSTYVNQLTKQITDSSLTSV